MPLPRRSALCAGAGFAVALAIACGGRAPTLPPPAVVPTGTWGGENAGVIVADTVVHVHIGCTFGNVGAPLALDARGHFDAGGSYVLRAYPIAVGPSLPARFAGDVSGTRLTITVTVTDTVEHRVVVLGPATVTLGQDPRMGPCPICVVPRATP